MREIQFDQPQAQPQPSQAQFAPKTLLRSVPKKGNLGKLTPIILVIIFVALGIFSGLVFASRTKNAQLPKTAVEEEKLTGEQKQSFTQTFRDESEGVVEKNDKLDKYAQGTHKLIRPGGESQTAYLTSSVLDLDDYAGKKVKVFGETFGSSQVGWLMDVGKVEVIE